MGRKKIQISRITDERNRQVINDFDHTDWRASLTSLFILITMRRARFRQSQQYVKDYDIVKY